MGPLSEGQWSASVSLPLLWDGRLGVSCTEQFPRVFQSPASSQSIASLHLVSISGREELSQSPNRETSSSPEQSPNLLPQMVLCLFQSLNLPLQTVSAGPCRPGRPERVCTWNSHKINHPLKFGDMDGALGQVSHTLLHSVYLWLMSH